MKLNLSILTILLISTIAQGASVEYGDGWRKECFDNGKCAYSNYHTIQRWDGQYIPYESLNLTMEQWPYQLTQNGTHYNIQSFNEWLLLPKNFANYNFGLTDISLSFMVTPAQLNSKSTANGSGLWYIPIPDKAVKTRFIWDNKKPVVYRNNNQSDTLDENTYWYSISGDQRRLNYNQTARDFGIASNNITFVFDSWIVGQNGNAWGGNSSGENTTEDKGDHFIKIGLYRDNFNDNNEDWLEQAGTWSVSGGRYKQTLNSQVDGRSVAGVNLSRPYEMTAIINVTSEGSTTLNEQGIVYARQNSTYFFQSYFSDNGDKWQISEFVNDVETANTKTGATAPSLNTDYYYKIRWNQTDGRAIKFWQKGTTEPDWQHQIIRTNYTLGDIGFYIHRSAVELDNVSVIPLSSGTDIITSGNRTIWHDSGTGNETYQLDINATTPTNTNYTVTVLNNDTDAQIQSWSNQTGNNSFTITGAVQDTKVNVTLNGNTTATPELMKVTFWTQTASGGGLSCGLNTLTNVTLYVNGSSPTCEPTNGTAAITMNYAFPFGFSAANDYYIFNMTTATSSSRIFNESSNNNTLGIQIFQGGLSNNANYSVNISNSTQKIFSFWVQSNSTGWIQYNTSHFNQSRYTVITSVTPSNPVLVYGVIAVVIISGVAYILRRVKKI